MNTDSHLFKELEEEIIKNSPLLFSKMRKGLSRKRVSEKLAKAGVIGDIDNLVDLYSWRNGVSLDFNQIGENHWEKRATKFFPKDDLYLSEIDLSIADYQSFEEVSPKFPELLPFVERYFPIFSDCNLCWVAIDLKPNQNNRVVLISWRPNHFPFRELYSTFDVFMEDVILCHREKRTLKCFPEGWNSSYINPDFL